MTTLSYKLVSRKNGDKYYYYAETTIATIDGKTKRVLISESHITTHEIDLNDERATKRILNFILERNKPDQKNHEKLHQLGLEAQRLIREQAEASYKQGQQDLIKELELKKSLDPEVKKRLSRHTLTTPTKSLT